MIFIIGIVFILCIITYFWYASIIKRSNKAKEALADVDVQLKQRSSLIPNILFCAKRFMEHEQDLFDHITRLREHVDNDYDKSVPEQIGEHLAVANELAGKMSQLKLSVENYPTLKSDETMVQAMKTYNEVEEQITAARRFYNAAVNELNNAVQIFPGTLITKLINIPSMPFYAALDEEKSLSTQVNI